MLKNLQNKSKGFTIVEVMIVLAIAGLIIMIVFLAVPALQRTSRNTQRRNDVSTYAAAVNEWVSNNAGKVPATADIATINGLAKLGSLTAPTAVVDGNTATTPPITTVDSIVLVTGAKCGATYGSVVGPKRAFVVKYAVEDSSGAGVAQCQEG